MVGQTNDMTGEMSVVNFISFAVISGAGQIDDSVILAHGQKSPVSNALD
jgi:hypothetical protein